jgi:hypothetical protein
MKPPEWLKAEMDQVLDLLSALIVFTDAEAKNTPRSHSIIFIPVERQPDPHR